jgi:hypothetical protein
MNYLRGRSRPGWRILLLFACGLVNVGHTGVTFITHGLKGDTDGWITGMANQIPNYHRFPGTHFSCYKAYFYKDAGSWYLTANRVAGHPPLMPGAEEIIVKFDWSQLADGNSYNTFQIANAAAAALLNTNFISELGGHALAEFPLHLIGHSRGGSLVCELSRLLGTNGVWIDHLTTLDPHPLNNDGFDLDWFLYSDVDAPARTYASVLFHDNYWQDLGWPVYGETVSGSYTRKLTSLSGGYSSAHSDAHLWFHGTIDLGVPASDTEASLSGNERASWWTSYEMQGLQAGFLYSRIGRGNRLSTDRPRGTGSPMISSGHNQNWDFGAGQTGNRTTLATNNGAWPSLIQFNRAGTNAVTQGTSVDVKLFYQWTGTATNGTISIYLDDDFNPLNNNQTLLKQIAAPGTGSPGFIGSGTIPVPLSATNAAPGWHSLLSVIKANGRTRYLYAAELIQVITAPTLDITWTGPTEFQIGINGVPGQTVILQSSPNLIEWEPLATNTFSGNRIVVTNAPSIGISNLFYRTVLMP